MALTGAQIRAARALLNISAKELAERSGVSYPTVQRAEQVDGLPNMQSKNLVAIKDALEAAGVSFIDATAEHEPGVRLEKVCCQVCRRNP